MDIIANWIWSDDSDGRGYNLCSIFRRDFRLAALPVTARLAVTADSFYRLKVNGQWLNDGPCRSWPGHCQYDVYDLDGILRAGANHIEAVVRYFGCGDFHRLPQRAGFLAQLEAADSDGNVTVIGTDTEWVAAEMPQLRRNVPKISIQQPPFECFDNSEPEAPVWRKAMLVAPAEGGPWKELKERDCRLLSRREFLFRDFVSAHRVMPAYSTVAVAPHSLLFPGDTTVNTSDVLPLLIAFEIDSPRCQEVVIAREGVNVSVNGRSADGGAWHFNEGGNFVVLAPENLNGHCALYSIGFPPESGLTAEAVRDAVLVRFPKLARLAPDRPFCTLNAQFQQSVREFQPLAAGALKLPEREAFLKEFPQAEPLAAGALVDDDAHLSFVLRRAEPVQPGDVTDPEFILYPDDCCAVIRPVEGRDIELCFDLGEQNIGCWNFSLFAAAGTVVDVAAIEYKTPNGALQHTGPGCRNSMRYICREGINRYTAMQRRSGRYVYVTLRNMTAPVRFQSFRLVESTYPVVPAGSFHCSDPAMNRIYEISQRTLKLCMEDTFTDCPLYEQTLWVGDARSESLFAMSSFGAYDLVRRCIRLAGQSLDDMPMVLSQVPTGWSCIIPAWSFMWSYSVYDYWFETGDAEFLREVWPMVKKNLEGAAACVDPETGLFSAPDWNFFDWNRTDCGHRIMLYNSFFHAEALRTAAELAPVAGEPELAEGWLVQRRNLIDALNRVWDARRLAWPDSIHEDGTLSGDVSIHTSMLAALFDAAWPEHQAAVRANTVTPRSELFKVVSPFALFYLYAALEKLGLPGEILDAIGRDYRPMLEVGATTVWENISLHFNPDSDFPTRSHCHAWSAAPLYFLPRLALGIIPAGPGCRKILISPVVNRFEYASGTRPTIHGRVGVRWKKQGRELHIQVTAPAEIEVEFLPNDTTFDFEVILSRSAE